MKMFFDTETTGFPHDGHLDHPSQPHIVQLAMVITDRNLQEAVSVNLIAKPDGWTIPPNVAKIHGITDEKAHQVGIPEKVMVGLYYRLEQLCEERVAHNLEFDAKMLDIGCARFIPTLERKSTLSFCTADVCTPILNLPPTPRMLRAGYDGPKKPKLSECIEHFFDEDLEGAHDGMVDTRACLRIYRHLKEKGLA